MEMIRGCLYRLKGSVIGSRVRIGTRVRIDLPWLVKIGDRVYLESDVWLKLVTNEASLDIGKFTYLGRGVEIDIYKSVTIGNHVLIALGVFISDHFHNTKSGILIDSQGCESQAVTIEDDCWLGAHSVIMPGVRIGKGAVVGAGAVVTKNVSASAIVAGVPAKFIRYR